MDPRSAVVMSALLVAACARGEPEGPRSAAVANAPPPIDAGVDAARPDAASVARLDPGLEADLKALGMRRWRELLALVPPPPPEQPRYLPAVGTCARPDAARIAAIQAQVERWIDRTARPPKRNPDAGINPVAVGCEDPRGVIVDVQADLEATGRRDALLGHWWVLRVAPAKISVIAHATGTATLDMMEWAEIHTIGTVVIADLDGDGASEPLLGEDNTEGGARPSMTIGLPTARGWREVGRHADDVSLAFPQPATGEPTVVLRLGPQPAGRALLRCVGATGPWRRCPAAAPAEEYEEAVAAAHELASGSVSGPPDADELDRRLRLLAIPEAERTALVARAPRTTPALAAAHFVDDGARARPALTEGEQAAEAAAREADLAARLRAATGDAPCPTATPAQASAAVTAIAAWVRAHEVERLRALGGCPATGRCPAAAPSAPALRGSCVAARGAYWLATWHHDHRDLQVERHALFFTGGGAPALVADTAAPYAGNSEVYVADGTIDAKFSVAGGALTALVDVPEGPLLGVQADQIDRVAHRVLAVVDGTARGAPHVGTVAWSWGHDELPVWMRADSLGQIAGADRVVTYVHATAAGVEPVLRLPPPVLARPPVATDPVGLLLEPLHRRAAAIRAARYIDERKLPDPAYRAEAVAALTLLGADPALIARVAGAAP